MKTRILTLAILFSLVLVPLRAAVIATDFFDYGDSSVNLNTLGNAGDGWAGGWNSGDISYQNSLGPISYTDPDGNYSNELNPSDSGGITRGGGDAGSNRSTRTFESSHTGEVWISILTERLDNDGDSILWFNPTVDSNNFISIRNNNTPTLRYNNNTTTVSGVGTGTFLMLAKLDITAGGNDTVEFWVNPDLSDMENSLGPAHLSGSGANVFNTGFTSIGVSFGTNNNANSDALRVGTTLESVTAIPEPGTLVMVGITLGSLLLFRRRKS